MCDFKDIGRTYMKAISLISYSTLVTLCVPAIAGDRWRKLDLFPAQLEETPKWEEASVLTSAKKYFVNRAEALKAVKVKVFRRTLKPGGSR